MIAYCVLDQKNIPLADLFDGRLAKYGIEDAQSPTATARSRCLTDGGCNYLWCWADKAGVLQGFESFMPGGWPAYILEAIATEFRIAIYNETELVDASEHDDPPCPYAVPEPECTSDAELTARHEDWLIESAEMRLAWLRYSLGEKPNRRRLYGGMVQTGPGP
jgi:hypothetical protein